MTILSIKKDKYWSSRGGYSRILDIKCNTCNTHICFYQKDGPGIIKRLYLDRISPNICQSKLLCRICGELLGVKYIYPKENRPAYKIFIGVVKKVLVNKKNLKK
jgi:hypothetical protein